MQLFRWEGGQCQAFAEVGLLDVKLLVSAISSVRFFPRDWKIAGSLQTTILAGATHLSRKEDVYTGGGACVSNLKTCQPSNKLHFFTQLLQTKCFLYRADDGLSRSPWSPSTWSFFSETLEQEAYNDTARRLLWYVQCPGYEDTMEPH